MPAACVIGVDNNHVGEGNARRRPPTKASQTLAFFEPNAGAPIAIDGIRQQNPREFIAGILHFNRRVYFSTISVNG
jgi:hypothetical protein